MATLEKRIELLEGSGPKLHGLALLHSKWAALAKIYPEIAAHGANKSIQKPKENCNAKS